MMRRRWRLWTGLGVLLVAGGLALVPSVRWPVYGWLKGDAFYQRMPTSWWEREISETYMPEAPGESDGWENFTTVFDWQVAGWSRSTSPDWPERALAWLRGNPGSFTETLEQAAPLVDGDVAALPVLVALLRSDNAKVRWVAVFGLGALRSPPPEVMPALQGVIDDEDAIVRQAAQHTLKALKGIDPDLPAQPE